MSNGRNAGKRKNPVSVRGPWFAMPLDFLRSTACAQLPAVALKMLLDLCAQLGPNASGNGDLSAAPAIMVPRGWSSEATRVAALRALIDADLIVITRHGNRRLCTLYAVTLWPLQCDLGKLSIAPGSFTSASWAKGEKHLFEPPSMDRPVRQKALRKNEKSTPTAGEPPLVMPPQRENPRCSEASYSPAAGVIGPISPPEVLPQRETFLDLPSVGVVVGAAVSSGASPLRPNRPTLKLVEGLS